MRKAAFWLLLMIAATVLHATSVVPMSVEELTRAADNVVEARAIQQWSVWDAPHARVYTYTRFAVSNGLKGTAPLELVVKQVGGQAAGYATRVVGVRVFQLGEQALLFLRPSAANDGTYAVVGLMQGHFHVYRSTQTGETMTTNGMPEALAVKAGATETAPFSGARLRLEELRTRVQKAVR